jgi:hypothetical protein
MIQFNDDAVDRLFIDYFDEKFHRKSPILGISQLIAARAGSIYRTAIHVYWPGIPLLSLVWSYLNNQNIKKTDEK